MNCADARHWIHLDAGGDLQAAEEHELAAHMESCSECRSYHAGMLQAMSALCVLRDFDSVSSPGARPYASVWSSLASKLPVKKRPIRTLKQFNSRVAALCVGSLALAVVTIIQNLPVATTSSSWSPAVPSQLAANRSHDMDLSVPVGLRPVGHSGQPGLPFVPGTRFQVSHPDGTVAGYFQVMPAQGGTIPQLPGETPGTSRQF